MPEEIPREPTRKPSTLIRSLGHDPLNKILQVEFNSGHVGNYAEVTEAEYLTLVNAESIGIHFIRHFRDIKIYEPVAKKEKRLDAAHPAILVRNSTEKGRLETANRAISTVHSSRNLQQLIREARSAKG